MYVCEKRDPKRLLVISVGAGEPLTRVNPVRSRRSATHRADPAGQRLESASPGDLEAGQPAENPTNLARFEARGKAEVSKALKQPRQRCPPNLLPRDKGAQADVRSA